LPARSAIVRATLRTRSDPRLDALEMLGDERVAAYRRGTMTKREAFQIARRRLRDLANMGARPARYWVGIHSGEPGDRRTFGDRRRRARSAIFAPNSGAEPLGW
jgi:hypothetical protein